jgi:hypothetical protein
VSKAARTRRFDRSTTWRGRFHAVRVGRVAEVLKVNHVTLWQRLQKARVR